MISKRGFAFCAVCWMLAIPVVRAQPANDAFINAIVLTGYSASVQATTQGATLEPGEFRWADNRGGHSLWYSWTAPETGTGTLIGTGPGSGLLFSVYVGTTLGGVTNNPGSLRSLTVVASNAYGEPEVRLQFHAIAGTTYRISVDGFQGEQGDISFSLQLGPVNDDFADATPIFGEHFASFASNRGATRESGESELAQGRSVWWSWTAPASGLTTLSCVSTNVHPALAVYTGQTVTNLTLVAASNAPTNGGVDLQINAIAGTTYSIVVDDTGEAGSQFSLELTMALLRMTAPLTGELFAHPANLRISVQVPVTLPEISVIDIYDDEQRITTLTNAPFNFSWQNVPSGSHRLTARGVDVLGHTNASLPVSILVYTNNNLPTPKLAATGYSSYAINALGQLYVWGFNGIGHFGLSQHPENPICDDPFDPVCLPIGEIISIPRVATFPPGVTEWRAIGTGWALGNDAMVYHVGTDPTPPADGATAWVYLRGNSMIDNLGRLYLEGLLWNPQGPFPWIDVSGTLALATNRNLYRPNCPE